MCSEWLQTNQDVTTERQMIFLDVSEGVLQQIKVKNDVIDCGSWFLRSR